MGWKSGCVVDGERLELVIFVHQGELSSIAPREHWELIGWLPAGDYRLTATVYTGTVVGEWSGGLRGSWTLPSFLNLASSAL